MLVNAISRLIATSVRKPSEKLSFFPFSTLSPSETLYSVILSNPCNVERELAFVKVNLNSNCVIEVLRRCHQDRCLLGLRFFIWAGIRSDYRHSSYMYGRACNLFKIKRNPGILKDLIEVYGAEECVVSVATIKVVLNLCRQVKLADEALWVLRKMHEFNLRADTTIYNLIIRLFVDKSDLDMADKLMKEMGLIDLYPDMITYMSMLKGFCDLGRLDDALRLVKEMKNHGCMPNAVVYSTLLDGFCRFATSDKALGFLGEMERENGDCGPNTITYTSVIQSLCNQGKFEEAISILDRMEARCCSANRVTASILIKGFCDEGHVNEVYNIINRVVALGGVSREECFSSFVVSLLHIQKSEDAEKLMREMLAGGMKPDSLACSLVLRNICSKGQYQAGFYLLEEMENTKGSTATIDSDIFSILLHGLSKTGCSLEASKLLRFMLQKQIRIEAPLTEYKGF